MIIKQKNDYGTMESKFKTKSTEVLRYSTMQLTSVNIGKHGENIVSFIQNHFVNKVDQVLLPKQFYMKQNFAFH